MKKYVFLFLIFSLFNYSVKTNELKWNPSTEQVTQIKIELDKKWGKFFDSNKLKKGVTSRDLISFILNGVSINYDKERVKRIIIELNNMQDNFSGSKTFGNFFWYNGDSEIKDKNAVEFVIREAILVCLFFLIDWIRKKKKFFMICLTKQR